jgi:hypothetical protein
LPPLLPLPWSFPLGSSSTELASPPVIATPA